ATGSSNNPAIHMKGGELHVSGGSIGGGAKYAIQLENRASLYLSDNPVIQGTDQSQFSLGAEIYLSGSSSKKANENQIFASDNEVSYTGGKLRIALPAMNIGFDSDDTNITLVQEVAQESSNLFELQTE